MALLSSAKRQEVWAFLMEEASRTLTELGITKADLRGAVDNTDQWIEDNAASYNQALPASVRSALTARQKALLFMYVARKRFGVM